LPFSGKNDKWQGLGVLEVGFKAVKEGEGKNKEKLNQLKRMKTFWMIWRT
jgi:hypothetical protein